MLVSVSQDTLGTHTNHDISHRAIIAQETIVKSNFRHLEIV